MKPLKLATKVFTHNVGVRPAVASDGRGYLVATGHQADVHGLPIAANGQRARAFQIATNAAAGGGEPGLAFRDGRYCVAWMAPDLSTRIRAAFVHHVGGAWHVHPPGGVVVDAPGSSTASLGNAKPSVAYSGDHWLIVWNGDVRLVYGTARGTRFTNSAQVVDPVPLDIASSVNLKRPAVVRLVEGFLVASSGGDKIHGARVTATRVSPGGAVAAGPAIPFTGKLGQTTLPSAANGTWLPDKPQALLVWTDIPAGLRGARVAANGRLMDANGFDIAPGGGESAVAWAKDRNAYLVAWRAGGEIRGVLVDSGGHVQAPATLVTGATGTELALASNGSDFLLVWEGGWAIVS